MARRWMLLAAAILIPACSKDHDDDGPAPAGPAPAPAPPAAPTGLTATPGDTMIDLHWDPVPGATSYHIESSTDAGGPYGWVERNFSGGTDFVDDTLQNGTTYYYRVYAANAAGDSPPSVEVNATPAAGPGTPGTLNFTQPSYTFVETSTYAVVVVSRSGGTTGVVSATFQTNPGTALTGVDYTTTSGTLTWQAGDAADQQILIPIANRDGPQGDRSFGVSLGAPTGGAALGPQPATIVVITD